MVHKSFINTKDVNIYTYEKYNTNMFLRNTTKTTTARLYTLKCTMSVTVTFHYIVKFGAVWPSMLVRKKS